MRFLRILNPENATEEEISEFISTTRVRAVVFDLDNKIGILYVGKYRYHKLPGGGREKGETDIEALTRECLEELGCNIKIVREVGEIIEYRKIFNTKQTNICYLAKVVGEKGKPSFTEEEIENEFQIKWLSKEDAMFLLNSDQALSDEGRLYIVPREKLFLSEIIPLT